jgi:hypothetical protein
MSPETEWPQWLGSVWWREVRIVLEAVEPAVLPPYLGSTLRGALGRLLRTVLCDDPGSSGVCAEECRRPADCRYYSLFERRAPGPGSANAARAYVLLAPPMPGLEAIAMGGSIEAPYTARSPRTGETIPVLTCDGGWRFDPGGTVSFGLRVFGPLANSLPAIVEALARHGLRLGNAQFCMASVRDADGRLLWNPVFPELPVQMPSRRCLAPEYEKPRRLRVVLLSPVLLKLGSSVTFSPADLAARFFEHSLGAAVKMYECCVCERLPWIEAPPFRASLGSHRLFHYELTRKSYRQDKWLDFDGVVGYFDLEGDSRAGMPWARMAEFMHFGQKAAFGLGEVRVLVLE